MKTNRQAFEQRHAMLVQRAEERFRERQRHDPTTTVEIVVAEYAVAVRKAIARRDSISAVYAVMGSHLAMKKLSQKVDSVSASQKFDSSCLVGA